MRRGRAVALGVGAVVVVAVALALAWCSRPPAGPSLYQLLSQLRAEAEAPGLTLDTAARTLATPDAAFAFVRDRVRYSPYPGRQQPPETVLRTRLANATDRAALLAALLQRMGAKAELRVAHLSEPPSTPPAASLLRQPRDEALIAQIADRIGYRLADEQTALAADSATYVEGMEAAAATMAAADTRIRSLVGFGEPFAAPAPTARTIDLDRAWVAVTAADGTVTHYDPTYPDLPLPDASETGTSDVAVTRIMLSVDRGDGVPEPILQWSGPLPLGDVELGFAPTVDPLTALAGPPDPAQVPLWTPILTIDGEPVTGVPIDTSGRHFGRGADVPPPYGPDTVATGAGGHLLSAKLASIDASRFPDVSLALDLTADGTPSWTAGDFLLTDAGERHPVRIRSLGLDPRPLVVVTDVSSSMDGSRFEAAKAAILTLTEKLDPTAQFALVDFAGDTHVAVPLAPVGDGQAIRDAVDALRTRQDTGIILGMSAALDLVGDRPATVVLLTDGQDTVGGDEAALSARLKSARDRVIAIAIGDEPDTALLQRLAADVDGTYQRIDDPGALSALYGALADDLSGRLVLDYTAAPGTTPRDVSLAIAGYAAPLGGQSTPPPEPLARASRLVLSVATSGAGGQQESRRPIIALGSTQTAWDMLGGYRLVFDIGAYPESVATAAYLTNWIDALRPENEPPPADLRIDYDAASAIAVYRTTTTGLAGDGLELSSGPNLYLLRTQRGPEDTVRTSFDTMQVWDRFGTAHDIGGAYRLQLAAGLAEGLVIDGSDAVTRIAGAPDLAVVPAHTDPPAAWSKSMQALRASGRYRDQDFFYAPSVPDTAWMVDYYHQAFEPFVDVGGTLAKGAYADSIAADFARLDKLLDVYGKVGAFGLGKVNGAIGPAFSALVALKREEAKLWCFSSVMLGYVTEAIEGTDDLVSRDADKAQARAAALCKIDGKPEDFAVRALRGMTKDAAKKWATKSAKEAVNFRGLDLSWTPPKGFVRPPPGVKLSLGYAPLDGVFHNALAEAARREAPAAFE
jgi:uncharacterized protein YegL